MNDAASRGLLHCFLYAPITTPSCRPWKQDHCINRLATKLCCVYLAMGEIRPKDGRMGGIFMLIFRIPETKLKPGYGRGKEIPYRDVTSMNSIVSLIHYPGWYHWFCGLFHTLSPQALFKIAFSPWVAVHNAHTGADNVSRYALACGPEQRWGYCALRGHCALRDIHDNRNPPLRVACEQAIIIRFLWTPKDSTSAVSPTTLSGSAGFPTCPIKACPAGKFWNPSYDRAQVKAVLCLSACWRKE